MVNKLRLIHFYLGLYIEDDIKPSKALRLINKYYPWEYINQLNKEYVEIYRKKLV